MYRSELMVGIQRIKYTRITPSASQRTFHAEGIGLNILYSGKVA